MIQAQLKATLKTITEERKRDLIPQTLVKPWRDIRELYAARVFVARHATSQEDMVGLLEMIGIQPGVENG